MVVLRNILVLDIWVTILRVSRVPNSLTEELHLGPSSYLPLPLRHDRQQPKSAKKKLCGLLATADFGCGSFSPLSLSL